MQAPARRPLSFESCSSPASHFSSLSPGSAVGCAINHTVVILSANLHNLKATALRRWPINRAVYHKRRGPMRDADR